MSKAAVEANKKKSLGYFLRASVRRFEHTGTADRKEGSGDSGRFGAVRKGAALVVQSLLRSLSGIV